MLVHRHKQHRAAFWGWRIIQWLKFIGKATHWEMSATLFLSANLIPLSFLFQGENCWWKVYNWEDFQVLVRICQWCIHQCGQLWDTCSCRPRCDTQSSNDWCLLSLCKFGLSCMDDFYPYMPDSIGSSSSTQSWPMKWALHKKGSLS